MGGLVRSMDWSFAIHGPTTTRVERLRLVRAAAGDDGAIISLHYWGNGVTRICEIKVQRKMCGKPKVNEVEVSAVSSTHLTIPGSLMTTNNIMASWSRMMWQSVVDRAVRILESGPFGSHFLSARVTVGGN
ncbi:hypothetical protein KIN20_032935 [Parelaphostrongylus tenuis]|uniref:Uncharacterized protein n=1 Tax=Parelaphostrongylus tenuis TaxID=148309 RepID=A0AAD5R7I8_PARTN|nr:hypothetical protein KIN20_032935 [Parelaphostrongylus tenuis]